MAELKRYFKVWYLSTANSFSTAFYSRFGAGLFLIGKFLRFFLFFFFLLTIASRTNALVGYNLQQIIFFFLTFNFIDTFTQLFLREVYRFNWKIRRGGFDMDLAKPINPLFRSLLGGADLLDLFLLVPLVFFMIFVGGKLTFTPFSLLAYLALLGNAILLTTAFHILVLALGIITVEIDHAIMIFRDITAMGRLPVDIYLQPLRFLVTFIFPVGIMMTYPAKAFFGLLSFNGLVLSFGVTAVFTFLSLLIWKSALNRYASASS